MNPNWRCWDNWTISFERKEQWCWLNFWEKKTFTSSYFWSEESDCVWLMEGSLKSEINFLFVVRLSEEMASALIFMDNSLSGFIMIPLFRLLKETHSFWLIFGISSSCNTLVLSFSMITMREELHTLFCYVSLCLPSSPSMFFWSPLHRLIPTTDNSPPFLVCFLPRSFPLTIIEGEGKGSHFDTPIVDLWDFQPNTTGSYFRPPQSHLMLFRIFSGCFEACLFACVPIFSDNLNRRTCWIWWERFKFHRFASSSQTSTFHLFIKERLLFLTSKENPSDYPLSELPKTETRVGFCCTNHLVRSNQFSVPTTLQTRIFGSCHSVSKGMAMGYNGWPLPSNIWAPQKRWGWIEKVDEEF